MRTYLMILSLCWLAIPLFGQSEKDRSFELGLNVTNTLAGFFNSGGQDMALDPYLFSLKIVGPNSAFRTGFNLKYKNKIEFVDTGEREVLDQDFFLRAGWEKRVPISPRFTLFWGLDGVMRYESEKVDFFSFSGDLKLKNYEWGIGGGPVLGVLFHMSDRISLSTESTLYGIYFKGKEEQNLEPGQPATQTDVEGFEILPTVPNSLYLILSF